MLRPALAALLACLVAVVAPAGATAAAPKWTRAATGKTHPSGRGDHALAAVSSRTVYLFGGRRGGRALSDLWRFDVKRRRWERIRPDGAAPAARFGHNLVAEPGGTLLLFGGQGDSDFFGDTWRFDPKANAWQQLNASGPLARYGAGGAIDTKTGALYVTHGFTNEGRFDDTWVLAGGAFGDISGDGARPLKRCLLSAAFHDGKLFLFGGQSNSRPFLGDLWRLDATTRRWTELKPSRRPSARNLYGAAQSGGLWYVHGGQARGGPAGDLWRLDLEKGSFKRLKPDGKRPSARASHALAAAGKRIVAFGGNDGRDLADTWILKPR